MTSRLRERRSRLAAWSSRFALVAIPILIIAAIGHRSGKIDATATYAVIALAFSLAALAVVAALAAFEAIWRDGRKGFGSAAAGFVLGLAILTIPAVGAWKIVQYPRLVDVSTDVTNPPRFMRAYAERTNADIRIGRFSSDEIARLQAAYPDIVPRYYPLDTVVVFDPGRRGRDPRARHGGRRIGRVAHDRRPLRRAGTRRVRPDQSWVRCRLQRARGHVDRRRVPLPEPGRRGDHLAVGQQRSAARHDHRAGDGRFG
jgi:hypothetical protein